MMGLFTRLTRGKRRKIKHHYNKAATAYKEVFAMEDGSWLVRIYSYDKSLGLLEEITGESPDQTSAMADAQRAADEAMKPYTKEA